MAPRPNVVVKGVGRGFAGSKRLSIARAFHGAVTARQQRGSRDAPNTYLTVCLGRRVPVVMGHGFPNTIRHDSLDPSGSRSYGTP
ncbi:MAG: hypothetical protein H8E66_05710 [Planctomycetes bacterium]|nr:hypothetical protein [Planctomycetota bacterium]